jgi:hypothetical protein
MQTFLPYPSFRQSAKCLDTKRLGKQRVECKQILIALGYGVGENEGNPNSRWRSHPAVRMWRGHEFYLADYSLAVCAEWKFARGYRDTLHKQFYRLWTRLGMARDWPAPSWLGMPELHASHRSNLLRKNAAHYGCFGWLEHDGLEYVWPVNDREAA